MQTPPGSANASPRPAARSKLREGSLPRHARRDRAALRPAPPSLLLVSHGARALLVDCGRDWLGRLPQVDVEALLLTHAHPDHAGGLRDGCPWPVHASEQTLRAIEGYPLPQRSLVGARDPEKIAGMTVEAFPVEHSLRAPAVGYRIAAGTRTIFYAPDLVAIDEEDEALAGLDLYVGDGAAIARSIVRRDGTRIGHSSIRGQLDWCGRHGVDRAIFTDCGSQILRDERGAAAKIEARLGRIAGVEIGLNWSWLVEEDGQAVGLLPFRRVAEMPRREWDDKHVRDCMVEQHQVPQLQQDEPAIDALGELGEATVSPRR
jgi:phosphoribosyl 1,2-cyclic phosphodiesterase